MKGKRVVILLMVALIALTSTASAHFLGGKWAKSQVVVCDLSSYRSYSSDAMGRWNSARSQNNANWPILRMAVYKVEEGVCRDSWDVMGYDIYDPNAAYAYGMPLPNPFGGTYTAGNLEYNIPKMNTLSDSDKKYTSLHEFGHLFGLAHNLHIWPSPSVMSEMGWFNGIYAHDISDMNTLYP